MKYLKKVFLLIIIFCSYFGILVDVQADLNCQNTLKYGTRNKEVKVLQKELNSIIDCNLVIDGIFGKKTYKCVKKFQKKYNLVVDGIVGIKTCTKINSLKDFKEVSDNGYIVVSAELLNVRKNASTSTRILDRVSNGTILKVYGSKKVNDTLWYKIKVNNEYGYVSGKHVKKNAIVLDISKQNLQLYKNGKQIMNVAVVTGNKGNHDTPIGHYKLNVKNKQTARTLRGTNDDGSKYNAYVDYWMPFITSRGIGFHDASWRTDNEYNTNTYQIDGSHGCVNMKKEHAKTLYNEVTENIDVFVVE